MSGGAGGAIGGGLNLLAGKKGADNAKDAIGGRLKKFRRLLFGDDPKGNLRDVLDKTSLEQLSAILTGYDRSGQQLSNFGRDQRREIGLTAGQTQAATDKNLVSRGLYGSGVKDVVDRGVRRDTLTAHSNLSERLAGLRSGLEERRTGALSQFYNTRAARETLPYTGYLNALQGLQIPMRNNAFADFQGGALGGINAASGFGSFGQFFGG